MNSLAAQVGTCSVVFFASSSSSTAEAAAAAPVAFVFLFVLSFLLLITFLFLLFVIVNDDEEGEEEEEAEHFGVRLLLIVAEEDVLVQRVKGIVEEEEEEEEEEKVIALFSLFAALGEIDDSNVLPAVVLFSREPIEFETAVYLSVCVMENSIYVSALAGGTRVLFFMMNSQNKITTKKALTPFLTNSPLCGHRTNVHGNFFPLFSKRNDYTRSKTHHNNTSIKYLI